MAQTITILEDWEDRGTDVSDSAIVTRNRSHFAVVTDDVNPPQRVSDMAILNAFSSQTGINRFSPWVGADGLSDPTCRATRIKVHQTSEPIKWEIRLGYSSARASGGGGGGGGGNSPRQQREKAAAAQHGEIPHADPTQRRLVVRYGHQEYEEALEFDEITGQPAWNSARERFVPPIMRPMSFRVVTLERNELEFDAEFTDQFLNMVNAGTFYRYSAGKVLCKAIDAELNFEGGIPFYEVTYVFWVRQRSIRGGTWVWKQLDAGLNELDANGKPIAIRDAQTSQPVSAPRPLDGLGHALVVGANPVYLDFNRYPQTNFALLGLGG